jgi:hypothetical protein
MITGWAALAAQQSGLTRAAGASIAGAGPAEEGAGGPMSEPVALAAARNAGLSTSLEWVFGGRSQRGWSLYAPLIAHLIGTESEAGSREFAAALARWQRAAGLAPTGVLDQNTWAGMIARFQSRRIKDRSYPSPDQLLVAPASDFYDPTRAEELRKVERQTYAAYKRMVAAAIADPSLSLAVGADGALAPTEKYLKIISAFRSREYQEQLRKKAPASGSAGLAVNSPHFTGRALDLYVGGDPVEARDENRALQMRTPVYRWLVRHAEKFGFYPYFYEPWHWEYVPQ